MDTREVRIGNRVIGGGNPVMVIHIQCGQTADVDLEFTLLGQGVRKHIIQAMNPLNDQNILWT